MANVIIWAGMLVFWACIAVYIGILVYGAILDSKDRLMDVNGSGVRQSRWWS